MNGRWRLWIAVAACAVICSSANAQSNVVLRDLKILKDVSVVEFDRQSVRLSNGDQLEWADILQAKVVPDKQAEFDRLIREVGLPRFRLRTRLRHRDWAGAFPLGQQLSKDVDASTSRVEQFQIAVALARGYLKKGQPEQAMLAFGRSVLLQRVMSSEERTSVSDYGWSDSVLQTGFHPDWLPVAFDPELSEQTISDWTNRKPDGPRLPGHELYLASLSIVGGDLDVAKARLAGIDEAALAEWKSLLEIQLQLEQGDFHAGQQAVAERMPKLSRPQRSLALYLQGRYYQKQSTAISLRDAQLALLKLAALYGEQQPSLVAAGLSRAIEIATENERLAEAEILRSELLRLYAGTYHGRLLSTLQ